jgi:TetR/AcrR family transcriptional repressor of nem operon
MEFQHGQVQWVMCSGCYIIPHQLVQNPIMPRPIEFDRAKAMNRAMAMFWRQGYQATSIAELLQTMDIGRSSFYAAFKDKRSFFIECLDLWAERTLDLIQRSRAQMPPVDALQSFFERGFVAASGAKGNWGCMLVNTVLEMAGVDDALADHASRHLDQLQALFGDCLTDAGAEPVRAQELAAMLMLFNEGIRVSSRRRVSQIHHRQSIATTFRLVRSSLS